VLPTRLNTKKKAVLLGACSLAYPFDWERGVVIF